MKPRNLKCPECGRPMILRTNRRTQERFFGCSTFPACRGTRNKMGMSKQEEYACRDYDDADFSHPGHPSFFGDR